MSWSPPFTALGAVVLVATSYDLLRTVLTARGGGPLTGRMNAALWRAALAASDRFDARRALSAAGPTLAAHTLVCWLLGLWVGWTLVFSGAAEAVVSAKDQSPATLVDRIYFVGYTITTLGLGDFHAAGGPWRVTTVLAAASGLMLFTMAITYIVPIVGAAAALRQLGSYIDGLGDDPVDVVTRSWDGDPRDGGIGFDPLKTHLTAITPMVATMRQNYLAYPILHYFHSDDPRSSAPLRLAALDEAVTLLTHAVAERVRLPRQTIATLRAQLNGFLGMLEPQWIEPAESAPPGYRLEELREAGIPTVSEVHLVSALAERERHRRELRGLVQGDGWRWDEVLRRDEQERGADDGARSR